jgi:hypothetical protein
MKLSNVEWLPVHIFAICFIRITVPREVRADVGAVAYPRGHILHDFLEARVFPRIVGPLGPGNLQYAAMWKVAQRLASPMPGVEKPRAARIRALKSG